MVAVAVEQAAADASDAYTQQAPRLRSAVVAPPMVDPVGEPHTLLEQLPDEIPLSLDDHNRGLCTTRAWWPWSPVSALRPRASSPG